MSKFKINNPFTATAQPATTEALAARHVDAQRKALSARELAKGAQERYQIKETAHRAFEALLAEATDEPTEAQLVELKALAGEAAELKVVADLWQKRAASADQALVAATVELKQHRKAAAETRFATARKVIAEAVLATLVDPSAELDAGWADCKANSVYTEQCPDLAGLIAWSRLQVAEAATRIASKSPHTDPQLHSVRFVRGVQDLDIIAGGRYGAYYAGDIAGFPPDVAAALVVRGDATWVQPHSDHDALEKAASRRVDIAVSRRQAGWKLAVPTESAAEVA